MWNFEILLDFDYVAARGYMHMSSLNQVHGFMITESDSIVHTRQAHYTKLPLQIAPVTYVCFVNFCPFNGI